MSNPFITTLPFGTSTGDLKQLYPQVVPAGSGATTSGTLVRRPDMGTLFSIQVKSDGTNGGYVEIFDVNGADGGADVNTGVTITNAQLTVLIAAKKAVLLFTQNFQGSAGAPVISGGPRGFAHGLAARFVGAAGSCDLVLSVGGGYTVTTLAG